MRFDYWELVKAFNFESGGGVDFFDMTLKLRSVRGDFFFFGVRLQWIGMLGFEEWIRCVVLGI